MYDEIIVISLYLFTVARYEGSEGFVKKNDVYLT